MALRGDGEINWRGQAKSTLKLLGGWGDDASVADAVVKSAWLAWSDTVEAVWVRAEDEVLADGVLLDDSRTDSWSVGSESKAAHAWWRRLAWVELASCHDADEAGRGHEVG